ncbi:NEDD8-activating enzyme E1 regulatory subunit [Ananas comosus]|uniref:NEDD8-activating enzyme E1 regulatory subunit n=1 Tax=Ananas comosus TaxID=4615 RepID=A0A199VP74_ANACO|nr:NEDD8-activating enzyme E1 regulatory subunit [Ananas comosus]
MAAEPKTKYDRQLRRQKPLLGARDHFWAHLRQLFKACLSGICHEGQIFCPLHPPAPSLSPNPSSIFSLHHHWYMYLASLLFYYIIHRGHFLNTVERRIWGDQGQAALEKASICLLNCGPTGSEALKNLVLGGIGSITVVDGSKVEVSDLGNNFIMSRAIKGKELNDAVKAKFVEESPTTLIDTNPSFFAQFTLVIATQLLENSLLLLDKICRKANVMLVVARSYGLTGMVRISVKEHTVVESKPDHFLDDLRLHNPWPELKQFAKSIDLNVTDPVVHKHTPYIVILVRLAEKWADAHDGCLPSTRQEKKEFKDLIKAHMLNIDEENYKEAIEASFKVSTARGISSQLRHIIEDSAVEVDSSSPDFWILVAALKAQHVFLGISVLQSDPGKPLNSP